MPTQGAGFLIANDILMDCSYAFFQPTVNTVTPAAGIPAGVQTVQVGDASAMYNGAQIIVDGELVTVSAVNTASVPNTFTATFVSPHSPGQAIVGATFPLFQYDQTVPMYTQAEVLQYLSSAVNDFLTDVPLCYAIDATRFVAAGSQIVLLPGASLFPVHVSSQNYPLRETSQSNMDAYDYRWSTETTGPLSYYRDKLNANGTPQIAVWPTPAVNTPLEMVYAARQNPVPMGLLDGFIVPDPFVLYIFHKTLNYAYSKDGESRDPGLARWHAQRYDIGCRICRMFLEAITDPNLELTGSNQ
jgi:hypothetical protein